MGLLGVAMGTFAMVLTLIGLRSRTPETTAALSTATQGWGYLIAGAGPLLVGVLPRHHRRLHGDVRARRRRDRR